MLRRQLSTLWIQRRSQNLYNSGDGLRRVEEVLNPKKQDDRPATWDTHDLLGNPRVKNIFHYSDRKAGSGYSNFRQRPYPNRPFIYPPMKKGIRHIIYFAIVGVLLLSFDHEWWASFVELSEPSLHI